MALPLVNNGDAGTDEAAVTTGNSGGDNGAAWDAVSNTGGGGGAVFDTGKGRWGAGAYRLDLGTAVGNVFLTWSTSLAGPLASLVTRHYFAMSALPSSNLVLMQIRGAGANRALVRVQSSGIPQILNAASSAVYTFGSALPANAGTPRYIRMETKWTFSATVGQAQVTFTWDDVSSRTCDSLTPSMDSTNQTNLALGGADVDTVNLGMSAGTAQAAASSHWIDDVAYLAGSAALPVGPPADWWVAGASTWAPARLLDQVSSAWTS